MSFRERWKQSMMIEHENKSVAELQRIILNENLKAQATNNVAELEKILGEIDACNEIIANRKRHKENIQSAKEEWKRLCPLRQEKAILNLKAAASPNGQLIAAILEDEDGLTEHELESWCEELESLPEEDLRTLLSDLVSEGIIEGHKDGKYFLRRVCTGDLFPENRLDWALQKIKEREHRSSSGNQFICDVVAFMDKKGCAMATEDLWPLWAKSTNTNVRDYQAERLATEPCFGEIASELSDWCSRGVLAKYTINLEELYFFPMLGDEGGKWA